MLRFRYGPALVRRAAFTLADVFILLALAALFYAGVRLAFHAPGAIRGPEISLSVAALPWYALLSLGRMTAAYALSFLFSLAYGYAAARSPAGEKILIPLLDVTENVGLPFTIAGHDPGNGDNAARVRDVIGLVDLAGKQHHRPDQLSAGEQQRVAIARALVTRPALLFADEPTGNLDYTTGSEILDALWRSCVERGQTIVLVTHDSKAAAYADRVCFVQDGRILEEIPLGRREDHGATPLISRLAQLGL